MSAKVIERVSALRRMSFYLDLKDYANLDSLMDDIRRFGGTIETFLSRDVKYVVTNRPSWRKTQKIKSHCGGLNSSSSLSSRSFSPATLSMHSSSSNMESSRNLLQNSALNSRTVLLLEKARQTNLTANGSRDVLEQARQWGSKVIHIVALTDWIKKLKSKHPSLMKENEKEKKELNVINLNQQIGVKLETPFVKYEDEDRLYCPQYLQMTTWPALKFVAGDRKICRKNSLTFIRSPSISSKKSPMSIGKKIKQKTLGQENQMMEPGMKTVPGNKPGFCEMCSVAYDNIYEHVDTEAHRNFINNELNFSRLDEKMLKLPKLEDYWHQLVANSAAAVVIAKTSKNSASPMKLTPKKRSVMDLITKRKLCLQPQEFNFIEPPNKKQNKSIISLDENAVQFTPSLCERIPFKDLNVLSVNNSPIKQTTLELGCVTAVNSPKPNKAIGISSSPYSATSQNHFVEGDLENSHSISEIYKLDCQERLPPITLNGGLHGQTPAQNVLFSDSSSVASTDENIQWTWIFD